MTAPENGTVPTGLAGWWATPPRSGMRRLINPIAYRHPRTVGTLHLVGGSAGGVAGVICLSYAAYGWAAFFLVLALLNFAGGSWYLTIARESAPRS